MTETQIFNYFKENNGHGKFMKLDVFCDNILQIFNEKYKHLMKRIFSFFQYTYKLNFTQICYYDMVHVLEMSIKLNMCILPKRPILKLLDCLIVVLKYKTDHMVLQYIIDNSIDIITDQVADELIKSILFYQSPHEEYFINLIFNKISPNSYVKYLLTWKSNNITIGFNKIKNNHEITYRNHIDSFWLARLTLVTKYFPYLFGTLISSSKKLVARKCVTSKYVYHEMVRSTIRIYTILGREYSIPYIYEVFSVYKIKISIIATKWYFTIYKKSLLFSDHLIMKILNDLTKYHKWLRVSIVRKKFYLPKSIWKLILNYF